MEKPNYAQLSELYLGTIASNARHRAAAGTIAEAVITAAGCGGNPDGPDLMRAACTLTRDAMGILEDCISHISIDCRQDRCDWARIDAVWDQAQFDSCSKYTDNCPRFLFYEAVWLQQELNLQSERVWLIYLDHASTPSAQAGEPPRGVRWHHQMAQAATFLKAASLLVVEAFGFGSADTFNIEMEVG